MVISTNLWRYIINNFPSLYFRPYAYRQTKTGLNAIYMYSKTVDILVVITLTKGNNPADAPTINYGHDGLMCTAFLYTSKSFGRWLSAIYFTLSLASRNHYYKENKERNEKNLGKRIFGLPLSECQGVVGNSLEVKWTEIFVRKLE